AAYILPTFLLTYGFVLAFFFFFRVDYSRLFFAVSFVGAQAWFHLAHLAASRTMRLSFDVLPFGRAAQVTKVPGVDWQVVSRDDPQFRPGRPLVADLREPYCEEWEARI